MEETVLEDIFLQLHDRYYNLVKVVEKHNGSKNDFIKIRIRTFLPSQNGEGSKIKDTEFTLKDSKTQKKEIFQDGVRLIGDYVGKTTKDNWHYSDMFPTTGFANFSGNILVIHQISFQSGFHKDLSINQDQVNGELLSLDIEYDDPFWLGVIFTNNNEDYIKSFFEEQLLPKHKILKCKFGIVGIAVKKLKPEWEKYELPKDRENLGHYTEHETFHIRNS